MRVVKVNQNELKDAKTLCKTEGILSGFDTTSDLFHKAISSIVKI